MNVGAGIKGKVKGVAPLGTTADVAGAVLSTADTYTDAAVIVSIDLVAADVESRLDAIEAKVDELLAAMK